MASRKEEKEQLRRARQEREQAAARAEERRRRAVRAAAGITAVLLIAGVVAAIVVSGGGSGGATAKGGGSFPKGSVPPQQQTDLPKAAKAAGCKLEDPEDAGADHVEGEVDYATKPPSSGNHSPVPADDAAYAESPGTERLVHSLEHGRVVIWFEPNAPTGVKGDLKALYDEDPAHMVLAPDDEGMPYEIAASAWTHVLGCPEANPKVFDAIRSFKDAYRDQGPEFVP